MVLFIFLKVAKKHGIYYFCFSFSVVGCFFFNPKNGISFILCCLHWISLRTMYYVIWHQAVFPRLIEDQRLGIFGCTIFFFIVVLIITVFQSRYRQICSLLFNEGLGDQTFIINSQQHSVEVIYMYNLFTVKRLYRIESNLKTEFYILGCDYI